ncbi:MAG: DNA polymerase III subunit alpha [Gemmatimonadetes bacterium]|nr:DNA polymerase III subunit alpha [Gemmatimonadota bacterium]MDA1103434.1 DNA polymerase III subunit alpha [Gemmatimonadota bacterium]
MSFVHLHTHSEYSLLDGANRIGDLVRKAKAFEMPGLALTDHGCMFGAWSFHKAAKKEGLKPIIGMEAYVAPGDRRDRSKSGQGERAYYHLVLLARDMTGYKNLVKLSSIGYTQGFYHKPRIDREVLAKHHEGIIVSSACMAGEVARHLTAGNRSGAREAAEWYANLFDGRYYLEVQAHDSPGQAELNDQIFSLGAELGLPVVVTNDSHFLQPEDHEAHDILLCIGLGKDRDDPARMRYDEGLYFKSADEMASRFPDRPDVVENTLKIADQVDLVFEKKYFLPEFPLPEGHSDENDFLEYLAIEGAKDRYGDPLPPEVQARFDYEMGVIKGTGYAGYFLITQDFIRWARDNDIPVGPGRGSAAGSLVAYSLGITNLDPLKFDLLFERFLNPERISMPDIDIDFCYERRGEVIEYTRQKYGKDAVGQIITFGTMKSRAVIRDVGRALGFEPSETDRIAKLIPNQPGQAFTVQEAVDGLKEVKELYKLDERHKQLFDYSITLEGLSRHASVHAAGVVIAPGPIDDYVPVSVQTGKNGGGENGDAMVVTQYDMNCLDEAGMLKMDFLGLKTLTVIHDAVVMLKERYGKLAHPETGETYDSVDDIPLDDPAVYKMLARGGNAGIFQFESNLANDKLRAMRCDRFEDLVATNALIRPGPLDSGMTDVYIERKVGRQAVTYPHPDLVKVLEPTYGVIVYQEQLMRIASDLAGFTLGEADVLRKAVGKKIAELIKTELETFVERAVERGVDRRTAADLAEQIETFGRYGFNRSHSAAYSLVSYHTAWLKAHYPAEFMAALLSSVLDTTDSVVKYISACRELPRYLPKLEEPLEVLPPDVNESGWKFTVTSKGRIRFGLGAVKGVGHSAVQSVLSARAEGRFTTLFDFLDRIDIRALNKRACEALIAAGALDAFGHRAQLLAGLDSAYGEVQARQAEVEAGQRSLFGDASALPRSAPSLPRLPEWSEQDRLAREKAALGFFISGHPLDRYREVVRAFGPVTSDTLAERPGQAVELPCVVTSVSRQIARRDNSEWGKITVEDFNGTATVLAFREAWQTYKEVLQQDAVVLVCGKVSGNERDEEDPPIFLDAARLLEDVTGAGELAIQIELELDSKVTDAAFGEARKLLAAHPGASPVWIQIGQDNGEPAPRLRSRSLTATPDAETVSALQKLFGLGNVRLVRAVIPPIDTSESDRRQFWRDKANRG